MRLYTSIAATIGWTSLLLRYLVGQNFESLARTVLYFSYFTIVTNILATLTLTETALLPPGARRWLSRPAVAAAATLYIVVAGLATLPPPLRMADQRLLISDSLLHYLMPILCFWFWLLFVPRGRLVPWHLLSWLVFPLLYGVYLQFHGAPYAAFDAARIGTRQVVTNTVLIMISFAAFGGSMLVTDRLLGEQAAPAAATELRQGGE